MAKSGNPKWCRSESLRKGLTVWEQMLLQVSVWVCTGSHLRCVSYCGLGRESHGLRWPCWCQRTAEATAPGDNKGAAAHVIISVAPFSALLHIFVLENISLLKKIFFLTRMHQVLVLACGIFFFFKLWHVNFVAACRIQFPDQGWEPWPPQHWKLGVLATGLPKKPHGEDFS